MARYWVYYDKESKTGYATTSSVEIADLLGVSSKTLYRAKSLGGWYENDRGVCFYVGEPSKSRYRVRSGRYLWEWRRGH